LTPYLVVTDAEKFIDFGVRAFNAREMYRSTARRLDHACSVALQGGGQASLVVFLLSRPDGHWKAVFPRW
jgi:uncharacterized glyoxalase superfamily protein PhnB